MAAMMSKGGAEGRARFKSLGDLIAMLRKAELRQSKDLDSAKEIQGEEMELLDEAEGEGMESDMEEVEKDAPELMGEEEVDEDDEFEAEKREFMQRDNKIGKPTKGSAKMILMLQGADRPGQKKGFKGTKGF